MPRAISVARPNRLTTSSNFIGRSAAFGSRRRPYSRFARTREVRKQACVLEHHAHAPVARVDRQVAFAVVPDIVTDDHAAAVRSQKPGDQRYQRGLAAARAAEDGGDAWRGRAECSLECEVAAALAKLDAQHQRTRPRPRRRPIARLSISETSRPREPERQRDDGQPCGEHVAVRCLQRRIQRQRQGAGLARYVGCERDHRAEFTEAGREGGDCAGQDSGSDQRQRDGGEPVDRTGTERSRGILQSVIDVLERNADGAYHQRKGHDGSGERRAVAGEGELDAEVLVQPATDRTRARRTAPAVDSPTTTGGRTSGRCTKASNRVRPAKRVRVSSHATRMANGRLKTTLRAATDRLNQSASDSAGESIMSLPDSPADRGPRGRVRVPAGLRGCATSTPAYRAPARVRP